MMVNEALCSVLLGGDEWDCQCESVIGFENHIQ